MTVSDTIKSLEILFNKTELTQLETQEYFLELSRFTNSERLCKVCKGLVLLFFMLPGNMQKENLHITPMQNHEHIFETNTPFPCQRCTIYCTHKFNKLKTWKTQATIVSCFSDYVSQLGDIVGSGSYFVCFKVILFYFNYVSKNTLEAVYKIQV